MTSHLHPSADLATAEQWSRAIHGYMHGRCAHLAVQVHLQTGLSLVEVEAGRGNHVICLDTNDMAIDIMGYRPIKQIAHEWANGSHYRLLPVADSDHNELLQIYDDPRNDPTLDDEAWARRIINHAALMLVCMVSNPFHNDNKIDEFASKWVRDHHHLRDSEIATHAGRRNLSERD